MAQEVISYSETVGADAVDTQIGELIVGDTEVVKILEIGFEFTGAGSIDGFVRQRRIDEVDYFTAPDSNHRVVKEIPLKAGDRYTFFGTDTSGAANLMGVVLVIDRVIEKF